VGGMISYEQGGLLGFWLSTWQRTPTKEDKVSWSKTVEVYHGQYGVHLGLSEVP